MRSLTSTISAFLLLAIAAGVSAAQAQPGGASAAPGPAVVEVPPGEIGILGGAGFHDRYLNPAGEKGIGPLIGARLAYRLVPNLGWFADYTWSRFKARGVVVPNKITVAVGRTGFELFPLPLTQYLWSPFLALSVGMMDTQFDTDVGTFRPALLSAGAGVRGRVHNRWSLRVEFRADRTLSSGNDQVVSANSGIPQGRRVGATVTNYQILGGLSILLGRGFRDSDGDGVADNLDQCPDTPRGWPVDAHGCPLDSDGDGVPDGADKCPDTPHGAKVDATGCPLDSDGDGVPDGIDQCPSTPHGAKVDATGCPIDSDGDGVPDGIDQCPDTPKGVRVDAKGCPLPTPPPPPPIFPQGQKTLILQGVTFETGLAALTPGSAEVLDKVAESLKQNPNVKVEVGGHTDSRGSAALNTRLSEARAAAVRDYLVSKGVNPSQLAARGYGPTRPIADNKTAEGRAMNRRVELTRVD